MLSFRTAVAAFITLALSISAIGQTKPASPAQPKPSASRPVALPNLPQIAQPANRSTTVNSTQQVRPVVSSPIANAAPAPSMPMQNAAPPVGAQIPPVATPSGPVSVDYRDGLLSVVAERAELGKVLQLVGSKIGTSIEVAPDIAADPVVAHISPATPAQVLAQLLDGPQLEYIVMGSDETGHVLNRVVVRKRGSFARQPLVAVKAPSAPNQASGAAK